MSRETVCLCDSNILEWDDAVGGTERWDALEVVVPTAADVVEGQR